MKSKHTSTESKTGNHSAWRPRPRKTAGLDLLLGPMGDHQQQEITHVRDDTDPKAKDTSRKGER